MQPEPSFPRLRSDYLQFRLGADEIFNVVDEEESKEPQDKKLEPQMWSGFKALLLLTQEKVAVIEAKLQSRDRDI